MARSPSYRAGKQRVTVHTHVSIDANSLRSSCISSDCMSFLNAKQTLTLQTSPLKVYFHSTSDMLYFEFVTFCPLQHGSSPRLIQHLTLSMGSCPDESVKYIEWSIWCVRSVIKCNHIKLMSPFLVTLFAVVGNTEASVNEGELFFLNYFFLFNYSK